MKTNQISYNQNKIDNLIKKSKEVLEACLLPNGCLVAAPSHMPYYPKEAKSYLYCWPGRDVGFSLTAALILEVDYFPQVLKWLWERAENFQKAPSHLSFAEGLILRSYYPNGRIREGAYQPDQNGTLLWAISEYAKNKKLTPLMEQVAEKLAGGLVKHWLSTHFSIPTEDLWEEKISHPNYKTNFTYSLAADSCGLFWAGKYFSRKVWQETSSQMKNLINDFTFDNNLKYFLRRFGGEIRPVIGIDSSMLGLVWPFSIIDVKDKRITSTVKIIEEKLFSPEGIRRYEHDEYEGEIEMGWFHFKQGAGAWPLINFWLAIVLSKMARKNEAEKYFWQVLNQLGNDLLIPEQMFPKKDPRVGVKPLLWSHMMFIHAAKELGYI